jgi:D-alanyl-D-alanine dipeptidase
MFAATWSNAGPLRRKLGVPDDLNPLLSDLNRFARAHVSKRSAALLVYSLLCLGLTAPPARAQSSLLPGPKPSGIPPEWKDFIGDYGPESDTFFVLERNGDLLLQRKSGVESKLDQQDPNSFSVSSPIIPRTSYPPLRRDSGGAVTLQVGAMAWLRRDYVAQSDQVFKIRPLHPIEELRKAALLDAPPHEEGALRKHELVELVILDPSIHLDIRYATSNDFLGTPVYSQARAFLERPAADALLRVQKKLAPLGYGLLVHDAYRPWYVTKIFWDATPPEGKIFVADPAQGSRHNRGCAVDLTLYDLSTGKPIEMPGTYDEMSPRSSPGYPGSTSLQRWHRDLLRRAMESEGFSVYESEWWHFDYKDWKQYPILNLPFEKLDPRSGLVH